MNYLAIAGLLVFLTVIIATFFVLIKNYKNFFIWWLSSIWLGLWGFGILKCFTTTDYNVALFWGRTLNLVAILIVPFSFHFCCIFAERNKDKRKEIFLYYIIGILYFLISILFPNEFVKDVRLILSFQYYPKAGHLYWFFPVYYMFLFTYGLILLTKKMKVSSTPIQIRNKIKYVRVALFFSFLGGSMTFLPVAGFSIPPIGALFTPLYVCIVAYAIMSNEILDIGFLSKKILSWFFTFAIIFSVVYISISLLIKNWSFLNAFVTLFYILFIYIGVRFIITKFNPAFLKDFENRIKNLSDMGTEKGVFNNLKDFANYITKDVAAVMNSRNVSLFLFNGENGSFEVVAQSALQSKIMNENIKIFSYQVSQYLNQTKEALIKSSLKGQYKELKDLLDKMQIEAVYPFFIDNILMGFITLGDSKKNYVYHKKEIEQLGYLLKLKEHIFANTYFLSLQKTIVDITQQIIDIDEPSEFTRYLASKITRQFNIQNSAFYVFDKEKKAFVCRQQIGYNEDSLPEIPETSSLLKVLNKARTLITIQDLPKQNSKIKIDFIEDIRALVENKLKAFVVAPLISTSGIIGIMFFGYKKIKFDYYSYDLDFIKNISTISSIKLLGFMIKEEAEIDTLTKAFNRKSLSVRLEKVVKLAKHANKVILFIFFDLDHFKQINDTKSHDFGDKVLAELSNKIKKGSRPEDMLFRLGGEEFVYVVGPIDESDVETIKKKFLDIIYNDLNTGKYTKGLTLSMSDVLFKANREMNDTTNNIKNIQRIVFKHGDDAVYKVKKAGRNNIASGGIVEDSTIGERYQMTIQIISDEIKYNEELGQYFRNAGIAVKYSSFDDAIRIFEKERPDNFLCIYYEKKKLTNVKNILTEIKNRSMSSEVGVAVKTDAMKKDLKEYTNLMFFNITETKLIDNWAKALAKDLE